MQGDFPVDCKAWVRKSTGMEFRLQLMSQFTIDRLFKFDGNVNSLFEKIFFKQFRIRILQHVRYALLPKLMSGIIRFNHEQ